MTRIPCVIGSLIAALATATPVMARPATETRLAHI